MGKFSFVFGKLSRESLHFFAKMNEVNNAKTKQKFSEKRLLRKP